MGRNSKAKWLKKVQNSKTYGQKLPERSYNCSHCSKSFTTNYSRKDHEEKHQKCVHCNGMFDTPTDLKGHLFRIHSISEGKILPTGSFLCSQCNRGFPDEETRFSHEKIHGVNFPCVFCPAGFIMKVGLQTHYADFHQSEHEYQIAFKGELNKRKSDFKIEGEHDVKFEKSSDNGSNNESKKPRLDFDKGFEDHCILPDDAEDEDENYENAKDPLGTFETDINSAEINEENDFKTETEEFNEESGDPVLWVMEGVSDT